MNQRIYDLAHELAREIKNSDEYKDFKENMDRIKEDEKNKEILDDFREKALNYQIKTLENEEISQEELKAMEKLEETLMSNPTISAYIQAEYKISIILNDINKIINEDLI